jgi:hypothetical protein
MQQPSTTMTVGHRSASNRMAGTSPYHFGHLGLAGEPTGPDLAQIWRSPARSGLFLFFSFVLLLFVI